MVTVLDTGSWVTCDIVSTSAIQIGSRENRMLIHRQLLVL